MKNIQIINQSNAQNELSKLVGAYVSITSYGQQLASWGKSETSGIILETSVKKSRKSKSQKLTLLQESEVNEFTSNGFQHQYFYVDNGSSILFVHQDDKKYTQDEINNLIK